MFTLAFLLGAYSYAIFFLGITGFLYKPFIVSLTILLFIILFFVYKNPVFLFFRHIKYKNPGLFFYLLIFLLLTQVIVNLAGALGPELAFDALWYHLTLPKIFLLNHKIFHIPGGLFYYSDMPKLTEMFYTAAISMQSEISAKIIHFLFGILTLFALYRLSRKFFNPTFSLLSLLIFYSNLVVGWESITAYVDLSRTFFEIMSLWAVINWYESKKEKWIFLSAVMTGFAISAKLLAIGFMFIFMLLIYYISLKRKTSDFSIARNLFLFVFISLFVPLPWFIFSFINTGNPVFPFFSGLYTINNSLVIFNPVIFLKDVFLLLTRSPDPLSPVYFAFLPLMVILFRKMNNKLRLILYYSLLAIIIWFVTPRTGGGRFILPYLPAFSLLSTYCIDYFFKTKMYLVLISFVIFISITSIIYRGGANAKYIPVILKKESKSRFLSKNLNFSFGDFYDTDGYFAKTIKPGDKVLLIGFHNLYYVDFPFVDYSFLTKSEKFDYIAVQHSDLPLQFSNWKKIYQNEKTFVSLYEKN